MQGGAERHEQLRPPRWRWRRRRGGRRAWRRGGRGGHGGRRYPRLRTPTAVPASPEANYSCLATQVGEDGRMDRTGDAREQVARPWVALLGDIAVLVVFVLVGRRSHHEDAGLAGFLRVWWPFAVGLGVAWLVDRAVARTAGLASGASPRGCSRWPSGWRCASPSRAATSRSRSRSSRCSSSAPACSVGEPPSAGAAPATHARRRRSPRDSGWSLGGSVEDGRTGRRFGDGTGTLPHHVPRAAMRGKPRGRDCSQPVGTRPDRATARGSPVS